MFFSDSQAGTNKYGPNPKESGILYPASYHLKYGVYLLLALCIEISLLYFNKLQQKIVTEEGTKAGILAEIVGCSHIEVIFICTE